MFLCSRSANADDFETMWRLTAPARRDPNAMAHERERWRRLWRSTRVQGVVMENLAREGGEEAVGIIVAVLVPPALTNRLLGDSRPLIDGLDVATQGRRTAWPEDKAIGLANADAGLDLLMVSIGYADEGFSASEAASLRSRVLTSFADRCAGNRICRYMVETSDADVIDRFRAYGAEALRERGDTLVLSIDRERALAEQNLWMLRFFAYEPPILGFSATQRAILILAQLGYTDQEIAIEVGKTQDSVKKRWAGVYARFSEVFPGRLPASGTGSRGLEKRRTLLNLLRERPEELRPYAGG